MKLKLKLFFLTITLTFCDYFCFYLYKLERGENQFGEKFISYIACCDVRYYNPSTEGLEITMINFIFLFSNLICLTFIFNKNNSKLKLFFQTTSFTIIIGFLFYYLNVFLEQYFCNISLSWMYNPLEMFYNYFYTILKFSLNQLKYLIVYFVHVYLCLFFIKNNNVSFFKKPNR